MTSIRFLELLLPLLLHRVSGEEIELMFGAEHNLMDIGYCFEADYIVVYRCAPEGDQLLGNSSANNTSITPPADLQSRIHIHGDEHLIGFQIRPLTHKDSGIYRRECWKNHMLVSQHKHQLFVCNEEVSPEEIHVKEGNGWAEILCNTTSIGLKGTSVRWYYEMYPLYKPTLFLDSSVSLEPLVEELQSVVEVKHNGALLLLNSSQLKKKQHFICLVNKGKNCLSFQSVQPPDSDDSRDIFASNGDKVVLPCPSDGTDQHWETPLGRLDGSSTKMHVSSGDGSEDFSLVIPAFSNALSGDYSCISSSLEFQYFLYTCSQKESREKVVVEGGTTLLECDADKNDTQRVQWHRRQPSGIKELIHDSRDATVHIPGDLRGRLSLSEDGSLFKLSHLEARDQGVYWCVVLKDDLFLDEDADYTDEYDDEEGVFEGGQYSHEDTPKCIFKQETNLRVEIPGTTTKTVSRIPKSGPNADPSKGSNVAAYAVGVVLVGLLLVGGIAAAVVIKRKAKVKAIRESTMRADFGCNEVLNPNNEYGG
ncbi:uncharacterized protein ACO6RY_10789 [Pungitius sinensis]